MGYQGNIVPLPLGLGGLHTDDPQNKILPSELIRALNLSFYNGYIEKTPGSQKFNSNALPSGVVALKDYWVNEITQRLFAVTREGKMYRFTLGALPSSEVVPSDASPATLIADESSAFVVGGNEVTNNPRKLFFYSSSIPQVVSGDGTTRRAMTKPALDWTANNQPTFGLMFRGHHISFGNRNNPHMTYLSSATDHEDFQTANATFIPCYSGEGERLVSGFVYKGALFVVKYPRGLYQLIDSDPSSTNWYFQRIQDELGGGSAHCFAPIINDGLIANANGSISSVTAVLAFGNLRSGEMLYAMRNENFMREETAQQGFSKRHCIYYSDKKLFMATYQSAGGVKNDLMLIFDFSSQTSPKTYWSDKDQANCLVLRKDERGVLRPIYGSDDGYIYLMDRPDRNVGGAAYTMDFQLPHMDMSHIQPNLSDQNKLFDFLELVYEPTGDFELNVEVFIDGRSMKTLLFSLSGPSNLDQHRLDQVNTSSQIILQQRLPLNLSGRRISLRATNANAGENAKLTQFNLYFRTSGQQAGVGGKA